MKLLLVFLLPTISLLGQGFGFSFSHTISDGTYANRTDLKTQPSSYGPACHGLPHFSIPVLHGAINVTCVTSMSRLHSVLFQINRTYDLSHAQFNTMMVKSRAYLNRDTFLSMCFLQCTVGNAFPRVRLSNVLRSRDVEPASVNIGCDDVSNMRCRGVCSAAAVQVDNGVVTCTNSIFSSSVCTLRCNHGFLSKGPMQKSCNGSTFLWSSEEPFRCVAACPFESLIIPNGDLVCTDTIYDRSVCVLRCDQDYRAIGDQQITCQQHTWMPRTVLRCERARQCSPLPFVRHGEVRCTDGNYEFTRCWLACDRGFAALNDLQHVCLPIENHTAWSTFPRDQLSPSTQTQMACIRINASESLYERIPKASSAENFGYGAKANKSIICDIRPEYRRTCGNKKVTKELCEFHNCCWDSSNARLFPCYRSLNTTFGDVQKNPSAPTSVPTDPSPAVPNNPDESHLPQQSNRTSVLDLLTNYYYFELRMLRSHIKPHLVSSFNQAILFGRPSLRNLPCNQCNRPSPALPIGSQCRPPQHRLHSPVVVDVSSLNISINGTESADGGKTTRVFGGVSAAPENWPWHAIVFFNGVLCGGTLIREDLVLTAAHCVTNMEDGSVYQTGTIALGVENISIFKQNHPKLDPKVQKHASARVIRHENFTVGPDGITTYDIALVKLNGRANVHGDFVKTLCLATSPVSPTDECYVTGFGIRSRLGVASTRLQQACLPIVSVRDCQSHYRGRVDSSQHVCAGRSEENSADTCRGDSGGPLVCRRRTSVQHPRTCGWYLAGITSFGKSPCASGSPSVFVNVFRFHRWIADTANLLNDPLDVFARNLT